MRVVIASIGVAAALLGAAAASQPAGLQEACRQFIAQAETLRPIEWGEYWRWTVVRNDDGAYSVGAGFVAGAQERYTVCIIRPRGCAFELEKLSRLR